MVGTWEAIENDSGALLSGGDKTYFADGRACGYNLSVDRFGTPQLNVFSSTWEIRDGKLYSNVAASDAGYLYPGEVIVDQILAVDANRLQMRAADEPSASANTRYKLQVDRGDQLCQLFYAKIGQQKLPTGR